QHLLDRLAHHRAAPDDRAISLGHEPERHELHAVSFVRYERAIFGADGLTDAHQGWDTRPVDVRIEEADARAGSGQGDGEVGGDRRLTDTPLTTGNRDDVLDVGQVDRRPVAAGCVLTHVG